MVAAVVGDAERPAVGQPARRHVGDVSLVRRQVPQGARSRIDDEEVLIGVGGDAHDQQGGAVR